MKINTEAFQLSQELMQLQKQYNKLVVDRDKTEVARSYLWQRCNEQNDAIVELRKLVAELEAKLASKTKRLPRVK